ncbi:zinc finger CCCH domain-containing protein 19 isoform X1 [Jatropha curcas]|uniref:zinc finger CCCH domain-containing protein 19 isoform X1 n=2 Tax=Jatropha curcas TaxID=180498 RepID=UPI001894572D|nr:zinc finger CCCH domain-containing protein 19 isoform X1 [Jatropha curcas]
METEEDDNSKTTMTSTTVTTIAEMDTNKELLPVEPQCGAHPAAELPRLELWGGGDAESQSQLPSPGPPETATKLPDKGENQEEVVGDNTSGAELSELEVGGGGGESQSPPPRLQPEVAVTEGGEDERTTVEEESGQAKEESRGIEATEITEEVPEKEEEDEGLIAGEGGHIDTNNTDNKDNGRVLNAEVEDNYGIMGAGAGVEGLEANKGTEAKMEVVADVAIETEGTVMDEGREKNIERTDIADETRKGATDTTEEEEMADVAYRAELEEDNKPDIAEDEEVKEEKAEEVMLAEGNEKETVAQENEKFVSEAGEMDESEMANGTEEKDNEAEMDNEEMDVANAGEEVEMTEETENAEGMELADGTEGVGDEVDGAGDDVEEVSRSNGGKRKRGKNAKAPARVSSRKKVEEDVCFICFDGGELVLCDRRGCPKAYHPSCVNRDDAFFRAKGRWNCGWHLCSICEKNAYYMCYTCTFSLCKGCVKDAVILCVRGNRGFCETCMKTVMLIERNEQGNKEMAQVDFDDKNSWEYLFKDYWIDLKERLSLTSDELSQAKNPWKGSESHAGKRESTDELYDIHNDGGSGSDSSGNPEVTTSKRRKPKKRLKSHAKVRDSPTKATVNKSGGASSDERLEWASNELLEFVMHMKDGDKSVCSQFDVQALLLEYIKRNKLRDPRRKSQIICDSRLEKLFGKPRVGHFEMLKLLESHFLLKEDSQADDLQGSVVDTETNQLENDGNSDGLMKAHKDKKRKSRKKSDGRGLQSNVDDYAAIDIHNINLIYLRRSLLETLIDDTETFHDKVVGSFVRIRISGSAQKQDLYRLVQVVGTSKAGEPYRVGKRTTDFLLEILNLNKTEIVSIDIISNQEFTEDECKRLRQSIKCGFINRLTVGDIQEKAIALQAVRVEDSLEAEITRLSHLRDRASDMGHRKELRECVEKLQLLKSPEERQRRLEEIPEIHADPNMDPSYESEEDEGETDDKRQENYVRPGGSSFNRRGREPISPGRGSFSSNDSWGGARNYLSTSKELSRNLSSKGFLSKGDDAAGVGETLNENLWTQGRERERETQQSRSWEKPKSALNYETKGAHSVLSSESVASVKQDIAIIPSSAGAAQSAIKVNETDKIWHYQDPSGKIQGPFSMVQLRKWSNTGYFPADLRIWRTTEQRDDSILLTDALDGNFQRDTQLVDNSFLKGQPHLSSSYSTNAGGGGKSQPETSNSTGRAAPTLVEVPKYSVDKWGSETNLPSPTPAQAASSATKGQPYESQWSPTPAEPAGSLSGPNLLSGGNGELQRPVVVIPESSQLSHSTPSPASTKLLSSANSSLVHSQSTLAGESPRIQATSHLLKAPDSGGVSVNAVVDMKSLQNLVQPVANNSSLVGTQGWGAVSVSKSEMSAPHAMPGSGSQVWGSAPSHKLEPNNSISMSTQPSGYGNWGDTQTSVHNSASSFIAGNTGTMPSDLWRGPIPAQPNIQPSAASNVPWGMSVTDNQTTTPRQVPENQNTGWGPIPGNSNMGWGGPVHANSNQGWVASGQAPPANANPGWAAHGQVQAPGNANPGWVAPVQGQAAGNAFPAWMPPGQGPTPVNANQTWVAPGQGQPPGNANPNWAAASVNMGSWGSEQNQNGERFSSQRNTSQGGDSGYGGGKPWNKQSSFGRERDSPRPRERDSSRHKERESSRPPFKGQRVCKYYHENGHCKKGAACDYLHT